MKNGFHVSQSMVKKSYEIASNLSDALSERVLMVMVLAFNEDAVRARSTRPKLL